MIIKESIERECCLQIDLKKFEGIINIDPKDEIDLSDIFFCKHCGQLWGCGQYPYVKIISEKIIKIPQIIERKIYPQKSYSPQ